MTEPFAAFSFVDRITGLEAGKRVRGYFDVPSAVAEFPSALVAEAIGQLAAWAAMSAIGFSGRPVAALAGETLFLRDVHPGDRLDLDVRIEHCDDGVIAYEGSAHVAGTSIVELRQCVGPMLPLEEFDAPDAVSAQFARLKGEGARPQRFGGIPPLTSATIAGTESSAIEALLSIPHDAPFFEDHFPRRHVFPATLLLNAQIGLARTVAARALSTDAGMLAARRMTHVKMRSFIAPGDAIVLRAELADSDAGGARIHLSARNGGRVVATARSEFAMRAAS